MKNMHIDHRNQQGAIFLMDGWTVKALVDDYGHLNLFIDNCLDCSDKIEIETGRGDGKDGRELEIKITTEDIEERSIK